MPIPKEDFHLWCGTEYSKRLIRVTFPDFEKPFIFEANYCPACLTYVFLDEWGSIESRDPKHVIEYIRNSS
jgi:hypothetical protein